MFAGGFHKAGMTTRENQQEQTGRARMDSVDHGHQPNTCDNKYGSLSVLACCYQTSIFKPKNDICLGYTRCSSPLSLQTHANIHQQSFTNNLSHSPACDRLQDNAGLIACLRPHDAGNYPRPWKRSSRINFAQWKSA